jgi:RNA-binding protein YlmH
MISERERIIRYYKASGDEDTAAHLADLAEAAVRSGKYKVSSFLDPYGLNIAETVAAHYPSVRIDVSGAFPHAERVKVAFAAQDYRGNISYDMTALLIKWDKRFYHLLHKDVLGALLALGCEREVIGDIVFVEEGAQVVVNGVTADFFIANLTQVGAAGVEIEKIPLDELKQKEEKIKEVRATVAALRLDAVAAAGYGVSRSHMAEEIKAQRVKVNWKEAKNAAQAITVGDVISFRGRGRLEITQINGLTKKGRTSVVLRRYI